MTITIVKALRQIQALDRSQPILPLRPSPRALGGAERAAVLEQLHTPRFVDLAPGEIYATLLDEGRYLCSERTMYRLLAAHAEVREVGPGRASQRRHRALEVGEEHCDVLALAL